MSDNERNSGMEASGSDDDYGRPFWRQRVPIKFCRTMTELEDEANSIMIKDCKLDACLDVFLAGLQQLASDQSLELPTDLSDLKGFADEKLNTLIAELGGNLDRLLPGEITNDIPLLENEVLKGRLEKRMMRMRRDDTSHFSESETGSEDSPRRSTTTAIPVSLFEVLMERQAKERSTGAQGSQSDTAMDNEASLMDHYRRLKDFIDGEEATDSFACGGDILVDSVNDPNNEMKPTSPPVRIFWSAGHDATARKVVLPLDAIDSTRDGLGELVASCDPASFGLGEKDVIDPTYRKSGKINPDQFATSFHPADFGILDNIEQILLPTISDEVDNRLQFRKIKAELYKLNIYSGPSGLFRKHVDTPRSDNQIGSLVVCLPSPFKGGNLIVQHRGQTVKFDWSLKSSSAIQWAAFYSDCEHEIETITDGDRITLTYNLFVTEPIGGAIPSPASIIDPRTFPLYGQMKDLLSEREFMREGGVLGIFCSHAYPHTSQLAEIQFPRVLKGADLVLYSIFRSLGIEVAVLPILDTNGVYGQNPALGLRGTVGKYRGPCWFTYGESDNMERYLREGGSLTFNTRDDQPEDVDFPDVDQQWRLLLMTRQIKGMNEILDYAAQHGLPLKSNSFFAAAATRVGTRLAPYVANDNTLDMSEDEIIDCCFPACRIPGITWITEPKHREMAFSHLVYGNEASIETRYSCVAILAVIPPAEKRLNAH